MLNPRIMWALASLAVVAWAPLASAYSTFGRWSGNSITMRAAAVSFPVGVWRTALSHVDACFDRNPSESFISQTYGDTSVGRGNGQFEVWFTTDPACNPAVTFWRLNIFGSIIEADVCFLNTVPYTTSMSKLNLWPWGGASRPFETTALHEYGHVGGLGHETRYYQIMGQDWNVLHTNGTTCKIFVSEDSANGLVALYTTWSGGTIEDVSTSLWRRSGSSGEYSTHSLCRMFNSSGAVLPSGGYNGQRRYTVSSGQTVRVQFTYENSGESTQDRRAGYYLSTNSTISTADTLLATTNFHLVRNTPYTYTRTLTLPALTAGQTYYLGVIIDDNSTLAENDESNASYHIIRRP